MSSNYAFKPIAEQALRSNRTFAPQRLNAALALMDLPLPVFEAPYDPQLGLNGSRDGVLAVFGSALLRVPEDVLLGVEVAWISGCSKAVCARVGKMVALRKLTVYGWGSSDLFEISHLVKLRCLGITDSPKLKTLNGISELKELEELYLSDNMGFENIEPIGGLISLEALCLEGGFSKPLRLKSLSVLEKLKRIRRLRLASIRVEDQSLKPLIGMAALDQVFIARSFPPSEFHGLAKARPGIKGEFLDSYRAEG